MRLTEHDLAMIAAAHKEACEGKWDNDHVIVEKNSSADCLPIQEGLSFHIDEDDNRHLATLSSLSISFEESTQADLSESSSRSSDDENNAKDAVPTFEALNTIEALRAMRQILDHKQSPDLTKTIIRSGKARDETREFFQDCKSVNDPERRQTVQKEKRISKKKLKKEKGDKIQLKKEKGDKKHLKKEMGENKKQLTQPLTNFSGDKKAHGSPELVDEDPSTRRDGEKNIVERGILNQKARPDDVAKPDVQPVVENDSKLNPEKTIDQGHWHQIEATRLRLLALKAHNDSPRQSEANAALNSPLAACPSPQNPKTVNAAEMLEDQEESALDQDHHKTLQDDLAVRSDNDECMPSPPTTSDEEQEKEVKGVERVAKPADLARVDNVPTNFTVQLGLDKQLNDSVRQKQQSPDRHLDRKESSNLVQVRSHDDVELTLSEVGGMLQSNVHKESLERETSSKICQDIGVKEEDNISDVPFATKILPPKTATNLNMDSDKKTKFHSGDSSDLTLSNGTVVIDNDFSDGDYGLEVELRKDHSMKVGNTSDSLEEHRNEEPDAVRACKLDFAASKQENVGDFPAKNSKNGLSTNFFLRRKKPNDKLARQPSGHGSMTKATGDVQILSQITPTPSRRDNVMNEVDGVHKETINQGMGITSSIATGSLSSVAGIIQNVPAILRGVDQSTGHAIPGESTFETHANEDNTSGFNRFTLASPSERPSTAIVSTNYVVAYSRTKDPSLLRWGGYDIDHNNSLQTMQSGKGERIRQRSFLSRFFGRSSTPKNPENSSLRSNLQSLEEFEDFKQEHEWSKPDFIVYCPVTEQCIEEEKTASQADENESKTTENAIEHNGITAKDEDHNSDKGDDVLPVDRTTPLQVEVAAPYQGHSVNFQVVHHVTQPTSNINHDEGLDSLHVKKWQHHIRLPPKNHTQRQQRSEVKKPKSGVQVHPRKTSTFPSEKASLQGSVAENSGTPRSGVESLAGKAGPPIPVKVQPGAVLLRRHAHARTSQNLSDSLFFETKKIEKGKTTILAGKAFHLANIAETSTATRKRTSARSGDKAAWDDFVCAWCFK